MHPGEVLDVENIYEIKNSLRERLPLEVRLVSVKKEKLLTNLVCHQIQSQDGGFIGRNVVFFEIHYWASRSVIEQLIVVEKSHNTVI